MTTRLIFLAFTIVAASALPAAAASFVSIDPPGSTQTLLTAINDGGAVAGGFLDATGHHGFIRATDGTFTIFENPFGSTQRFDILGLNASGEVAGTAYDNGVGHGFFRQPDGTITIFDAFDGGGTYPSAINNAGVIVGYYPNAGNHGFIRAVDGSIITIDAPGGAGTLAGTVVTAINNQGWITGYAGNGSFERDAAGNLTTFTVPTSKLTVALSINDLNMISGRAGNNNHYSCFLRSQTGTIIKLRSPDGPPGLATCFVNTNSEMSGVIGAQSKSTLKRHGWLRSASGAVTIFDFPGAGRLGTDPDAMNSDDVVTGYYVDPSHVVHGFLRLP